MDLNWLLIYEVNTSKFKFENWYNLTEDNFKIKVEGRKKG